MEYTIEYYSDKVRLKIRQLPLTMLARYFHLTDRMKVYGPNLGLPHTRAMGDGLFEIRIKGDEGIARVFYGTAVGRKIVILHSFVKKTNKTPPKELALAKKRLKEMNNADT